MEKDSQLYLMLGRIEGKVEAFLSTAECHFKTIQDHETRLMALEQAAAAGRGFLSGAKALWGIGAALVSALAAAAVYWGQHIRFTP